MKLPMPNATLLSVHGPSRAEDYGTAADDGPERWAGQEGVYLHQRVERTEGGGGSSEVVSRTLIVAAELPVAWTDGDIVAVQGPSGPVSGRVRVVTRTEHPGAPGVVRLVLEDR